MNTLLRVMVLVGLILAPYVAATAGNVEMVYWEDRDWQGGGTAQRLTLWADGGSELSETQSLAPAESQQLKPGWKVRGSAEHPVYYLLNPLPKAEAKKRLDAALSAGMQKLKTFAPGYYDGSGTRIGIKTDGKLHEITIPLFIMPGVQDNRGSDNYFRAMAVKKAFGNFDATPFKLALNPEKVTTISIDHFIPMQQRTEHVVLDKQGDANISVESQCMPPEKVAAHWTASGTGNRCIYLQDHVLAKDEATVRFNSALKAGIIALQSTKSPAPGTDSVTLRMRTDNWEGKTVMIATDAKQNEKNNFDHFMAVEKALGTFDMQIEKKAP